MESPTGYRTQAASVRRAYITRNGVAILAGDEEEDISVVDKEEEHLMVGIIDVEDPTSVCPP